MLQFPLGKASGAGGGNRLRKTKPLYNYYRIFFPRFWCVASLSVNTRPLIRNLAGELIEGEALADDPVNS